MVETVKGKLFAMGMRVNGGFANVLNFCTSFFLVVASLDALYLNRPTTSQRSK